MGYRLSNGVFRNDGGNDAAAVPERPNNKKNDAHVLHELCLRNLNYVIYYWLLVIEDSRLTIGDSRWLSAVAVDISFWLLAIDSQANS